MNNLPMEPTRRIQALFENQTGSPTKEFKAGDLSEFTCDALCNHVFAMVFPNENLNQYNVALKYCIEERHGARWVNFDSDQGLGFAIQSHEGKDYVFISVSIVKKEAVAPTMMASSPASLKTEAKPRVAKKSRATTKAKAPTARKRNVSKKGPSRGIPVKVYDGLPDDNLKGDWPDGWTMEKWKRLDGKVDSYWYSPIENKKLRSMKEVERFMAALEEKGGDEDKAWKVIHKK